MKMTIIAVLRDFLHLVIHYCLSILGTSTLTLVIFITFSLVHVYMPYGNLPIFTLGSTAFSFLAALLIHVALILYIHNKELGVTIQKYNKVRSVMRRVGPITGFIAVSYGTLFYLFLLPASYLTLVAVFLLPLFLVIYSQGYFYVVLEDFNNPLKALFAGWQLSKGNVLRVFGLGVIGGLMYIGCSFLIHILLPPVLVRAFGGRSRATDSVCEYLRAASLL